MSYWERASDQQLKAIETFCCGKELLDLGGYDGSLGVHLLERGADRVINVDKENPFHSRSHPRLIKRNLTFAEFDKQYPTDQWATAILSTSGGSTSKSGRYMPPRGSSPPGPTR